MISVIAATGMAISFVALTLVAYKAGWIAKEDELRRSLKRNYIKLDGVTYKTTKEEN